MSEYEINKLKEKFSCFNKIRRANKAYQDFLEIVRTNSKSNRAIEESEVMQAFDDYLIMKKESPDYLKEKTILYRARKVDDEKQWITSESGIGIYVDDGECRFSGFNEYESKEAPLDVPPVGRNNIKGMPYLYVAEDEFTACAELEPSNRSLISLAKFITITPLRIIDLRKEKKLSELPLIEHPSSHQELEYSMTTLFTKIMGQFARPVVKKEEEYKASQIFADYIRRSGFDGVRYMSSKTGGVNITIFNSHKTNIQFLESKLVYTSCADYHIIDLNSKQEIQPLNSFHEYAHIHIDEVSKIVKSNIQLANPGHDYSQSNKTNPK